MRARLGDLVGTARRRRFVGRATEIDLFDSALTATDLPFHVLYVFGPGGVGKTTLLGMFAARCDHAEVAGIHLDARNVEPSPDAFLAALRLALGLPPDASPVEALAQRGERHVLLIDTFEVVAPIDQWLRDVFLPQLPSNVLVVLAGRYPPSASWRSDPGWQPLLRVISLRNLSPTESRAYLTKREIPVGQQQAILDFTHGHPLALSLVADLFDQRRDVQFTPEAAPDIVKTLLEQLVQKVPGPAHRAALEASALVRVTTEALLAHMLGVADVHELFAWLRGLSFIESGRLGLFPHDLTREALVADVRWRNPEWYVELHRRARTYYAARLQQTHGLEQQRILLDYIFLHRDNPVVRPFFDLLEDTPRYEDGRFRGGSPLPDVARETDDDALIAMVVAREGARSGEILAHWLARQRKNVLVFRGAQNEPIGLVAMIGLHQARAEDLAPDPGALAAWQYLSRHAPLRPGEVATIFRFWMVGDTYQAVSPVQTLIFVNMVRHYLTTPNLAFTFLPCAEPDFWAPVFAYADLARLTEADFVVDGRCFGVYGHDWRAVPPTAWLELLAEREIASTSAENQPPRSSEPLLVLSQAEFFAAVREALHALNRPEALRGNPLLRSRLVVEAVGPNASLTDRIATLQTLTREAANSLQRSPREEKLYRALYHTYLQPSATQEQAAEILDVPFSTFRRHLSEGIGRVAEYLWQRELGGLAK